MPALQLSIDYRTTAPEAGTLFELFNTTGWNEEYRLSEHELARAVEHSWHVVSAYHEDTLVGFGRIISDGVYHALIVDLIVRPAYQRHRIGGALIDLLLDRCRAYRVRDVQLFCAPGKRPFYDRFGFRPRAADAPGMDWTRRFRDPH